MILDCAGGEARRAMLLARASAGWSRIDGYFCPSGLHEGFLRSVYRGLLSAWSFVRRSCPSYSIREVQGWRRGGQSVWPVGSGDAGIDGGGHSFFGAVEALGRPQRPDGMSFGATGLRRWILPESQVGPFIVGTHRT